MNKSQRIYFESGNTTIDSHVKIQLEQEVDTIEFLSMSINTKDVYRDFNADYGVLVGRVTANGGIGIPNAKISIFIPLSDEDAEDSEIVSYYPYRTPRDKNLDGKRYNLLPRVSKIDPETGVISPKQPFGSFPIKEEVIINDPHYNVYRKYYKYTALTNNSGDYMIFGAPIGTQTVHLSVDITDIGEYSMTPAAMVTNLGYSPNLFTDNNSKIKPSNDLNDLPHIETQEISVDIIPFWGDTENFDIGITRQDFRIRSVLQNTFVIFGAAYTDGEGSMWGGVNYNTGMEVYELYRTTEDKDLNVSLASKRIGNITESIYYYPSSVSDEEIALPTTDPRNKMVKLSPTEYSTYKRDGDFVFIISCNRKKVITSQSGEETPVADDYPGGVFTEFKGFITLQYTTDNVPMNWVNWLDTSGNNRGKTIPVRPTFKFPQSATKGHSFRNEVDPSATNDTHEWRRQHSTFKAGNLYSIAYFHGTVYNGNQGDTYDPGITDGFLTEDKVNDLTNGLGYETVGIIQTNDYPYTGSTQYQMPNNAAMGLKEIFAANWMNFSVHFPQIGNLVSHRGNVREMRSNSNFSQNFKNSDYYYLDNTQQIAAGDFNTKWFGRSDLHWTDFIEVPETDIRKIINQIGTKKGFRLSELPETLDGDYKNGQDDCPINGGKLNGNPAENVDPDTYFFRGFSSSDCLQYLIELGIINE